MNDTGSHRLWLLIVFILGFALGFLFRASTGGGPHPSPTPAPTGLPEIVTATPSPPAATPTCVPWGVQGTKNVVVGPDIRNCNPDCQRMSKNDTVVWAGMTTDDLWIEFAEKPFLTMYPGQYQPNRADCAGNTCRSGPVGPKPSDAQPCVGDPTHWCREYKYTQVFHGPVSNAVADGRIIIQW